MSLNTNLKGRLRNTTLPKTQGLLPVFEAVINSIHAIEESGYSTIDGKIKVEIVRINQSKLKFSKDDKPGPDAEDEIVGFKIIDNGIGFNDTNMESFIELDSEHKIDKGCRGVGRLLWLKAFEKAVIESWYRSTDNKYMYRKFVFDKENGVVEVENRDSDIISESKTIVYLNGFKAYYKEYARKTTLSIANMLFEHCLWYFIREGSAPQILVFDNSNTINLLDIYDDHMISSSSVETIKIKDVDFDIIHVRLSNHTIQTPFVSFCADNRVVKQESISGKIPGLYGKLNDAGKSFIYSCYVTSSYLSEHVRSERIEFDIENSQDDLFSEKEISLQDIKISVLVAAQKYLEPYLVENIRAAKERVAIFASEKAPKYRPIISRLREEDYSIDPNLSDKELDLALHKKLTEIESELISQGHDILVPTHTETPSEYKQRVQAYLDTASDIKKSDLASYVSHRKVIIDLLKSSVEKTRTGDYSTEDVIHQLIMPMGMTSNDIPFESANLWLIDERLAFHDYLASDKSIKSMPITASQSGKEPDIVALNVFENPLLVSEGNNLPLASIVVVELKRPMRDDAKEGEEKDPIEQALGYLERIRAGNIRTSKGRPIPASESIPGFCYILSDITPSIARRCIMHDGILTSDGMGYFFYKKNYKAYVEIFSYDRLINLANDRNRAFFDKLGLPCN